MLLWLSQSTRGAGDYHKKRQTMFLFPIKMQLDIACARCTEISPSQYPILRHFLKFTHQELIDYLRKNTQICDQIMSKDGDKRYSPSTFIMPTQEKYLVGLSTHNIQHTEKVQSFNSLEEAVADYVLLNWKLPRLRPSQTEKILRCPDFITFFDENGNIFDKRHGRFKYYDQAQKKFVYYD